MSVIRNYVGRPAAFDETNVQSARAEFRIRRQSHCAQTSERRDQLVDSRVAKFGVGGVRHASGRSDFRTQGSFGCQSDTVLRGLPVDEKSACVVGLLGGEFIGGPGAETVAFFPDYKKQADMNAFAA